MDQATYNRVRQQLRSAARSAKPDGPPVSTGVMCPLCGVPLRVGIHTGGSPHAPTRRLIVDQDVGNEGVRCALCSGEYLGDNPPEGPIPGLE